MHRDIIYPYAPISTISSAASFYGMQWSGRRLQFMRSLSFHFKQSAAPMARAIQIHRHCFQIQHEPKVFFSESLAWRQARVQPWQRSGTMSMPCRSMSTTSVFLLTLFCILLVCSILVFNQRSWQMSSANPLLNCLSTCSRP